MVKVSSKSGAHAIFGPSVGLSASIPFRDSTRTGQFQQEANGFMTVVAAGAAVLLLVYLVFALLAPEKF